MMRKSTARLIHLIFMYYNGKLQQSHSVTLGDIQIIRQVLPFVDEKPEYILQYSA